MQIVPRESKRKCYVKKSGCPALGMVKKLENKNIRNVFQKKKKEQVGRRTPWNLNALVLNYET